MMQLLLDPLNAFVDVEGEVLLEASGYIPIWATASELAHLPLKEALTKAYGFGDLYHFGGSVDHEGVYHSDYEEPDETGYADPPLMPYYVLQRNDEVLLQYEHAIVAIRDNKGEYFITRMD